MSEPKTLPKNGKSHKPADPKWFITDCAACGICFGMTTELHARRKYDHKMFYCPNGHQLSYPKTKDELTLEQARAEVSRLKGELAQMTTERDALAAQYRTLEEGIGLSSCWWCRWRKR